MYKCGCVVVWVFVWVLRLYDDTRKVGERLLLRRLYYPLLHTCALLCEPFTYDGEIRSAQRRSSAAPGVSLFSFLSIDLVALLGVDPHDHNISSTNSTSAPCCLSSLPDLSRENAKLRKSVHGPCRPRNILYIWAGILWYEVHGYNISTLMYNIPGIQQSKAKH